MGCEIEVTDSDAMIAAVTRKGRGFKILLNPNKIQEHGLSCDFVIAHEVMHAYLAHLNIISTKKSVDFRLMNTAQDVVINTNLLQIMSLNRNNFKVGIFTDSFVDVGITEKQMSDYVSTKNSIEIYEILEQKQKENPNQNFCGTDASDLRIEQKDMEQLAENLNKMSEDVLSKLSDMENKILGDSDNKKIGKDALGMARKILESRKQKPSSALLKIFLQKSLNSLQKVTTSKKSSRRSEIFDATIKVKQSSVCFIVDTSGSITDEDLLLAKNLIEEVSKRFKCTVRFVDAALQNEIKVNKKMVLNRDVFKGGGGTDMNFGFLKTDKFLHYVILTDGYIPKIENKKRRTLFLYKNGIQVEGEKCYELK